MHRRSLCRRDRRSCPRLAPTLLEKAELNPCCCREHQHASPPQGVGRFRGKVIRQLTYLTLVDILQWPGQRPFCLRLEGRLMSAHEKR
jgi:hypothetical protein